MDLIIIILILIIIIIIILIIIIMIIKMIRMIMIMILIMMTDFTFVCRAGRRHAVRSRCASMLQPWCRACSTSRSATWCGGELQTYSAW